MSTFDDYNATQDEGHRLVCERLQEIIASSLESATSKIWHGHPVWFLDDNPIVGYSVQKAGVRLMFWSGRSFDEPLLSGTSRFQDASIFYNHAREIDEDQLKRWLEKSKTIQWDYKNIVKRKGHLERL